MTAPPSASKHRVLLTGATGFVGFRTARRLLSLGHDVRSLVRRFVQFSTVSVHDFSRLDGGDFDEATLPARDPASTHPSVHLEDLVDAPLFAIAAAPLPGTARIYDVVGHNGTWGA